MKQQQLFPNLDQHGAALPAISQNELEEVRECAEQVSSAADALTKFSEKPGVPRTRSGFDGTSHVTQYGSAQHYSSHLSCMVLYVATFAVSIGV